MHLLPVGQPGQLIFGHHERVATTEDELAFGEGMPRDDALALDASDVHLDVIDHIDPTALARSGSATARRSFVEWLWLCSRWLAITHNG